MAEQYDDERGMPLLRRMPGKRASDSSSATLLPTPGSDGQLLLHNIPIHSPSSSKASSVGPLVEEEIVPRNDPHCNCAWWKTMFLMTSEFVGAALLGFPYIFMKLGYLLGIVMVTFIMAAYVYTSRTIGRFCLKNPGARDIVDIAEILCGKRFGKAGRIFTTFMFVTNNIWVMGVHISAGGKFLRTVLPEVALQCAPVMSCVLATIMCLVVSSGLRTLSNITCISYVAVVFTIASLMTQLIAVPDKGEGTFDWKPAAVTDLEQGMVAICSIAFAFVGQLTTPSLIAQMKRPQEFNKALYISAGVEYIVFSLFGLVMYGFSGQERMTDFSPDIIANDSLRSISYWFMAPTIFGLGILYSNVTAHFVWVRFFPRHSRHYAGGTWVAWGAWVAICFSAWTCAFIVSQLIPNFITLLGIIGAFFDAFMGYIYWGYAWLFMWWQDKRTQPRRLTQTQRIREAGQVFLNSFLIMVGIVVFLSLGTWASISDLVGPKAGESFKPFSCASNEPTLPMP